MNEFLRTESLLGIPAVEKLKNSNVAVFGVGGVGGYVAEALVRSGLGNITVVDNDTVSVTNINRQIIALHSTVGRLKTEVIKERLTDINPLVSVNAVNAFYLPENSNEFPLDGYDYVVDAVDTVTAKLCLIENAKSAGVKIISCMGTGNKLDPTLFKIADISKTSGCPLAKVMRRELKNRNISGVKVLFSEEVPKKSNCGELKGNSDRIAPSSIAYMPAIAGLMIAAEVIKDLTENL